jgi:hypothetical protein
MHHGLSLAEFQPHASQMHFQWAEIVAGTTKE